MEFYDPISQKEAVEDIEVFVCSICKSCFPKNDIFSHMVTDHKSDKEVQDLIKRPKSRKKTNRAESKQVGQNLRLYKCTNCSYKTNYLTTFQRHRLLHQKQLNMKKCSLCSYATVQVHNLQRHMKNLHPDGTVETTLYIRSIGGVTLPDPIAVMTQSVQIKD